MLELGGGLRCLQNRGVGSNLLVGGPWRAREREPITGVWGRSPQRGPGAEPLVRRSGGRSPPEAESFLTFGRPTKAAEFAVLTISCEVRICDVSAKLNRLPCNPPPENWDDNSNWMGSLVLESGEG